MKPTFKYNPITQLHDKLYRVKINGYTAYSNNEVIVALLRTLLNRLPYNPHPNLILFKPKRKK